MGGRVHKNGWLEWGSVASPLGEWIVLDDLGGGEVVVVEDVDDECDEESVRGRFTDIDIVE